MYNINERVPSNVLLLFANNYGGKDYMVDYPNIPTELYNAIKDWEYEHYKKFVIFDYETGTTPDVHELTLEDYINWDNYYDEQLEIIYNLYDQANNDLMNAQSESEKIQIIENFKLNLLEIPTKSDVLEEKYGILYQTMNFDCLNQDVVQGDAIAIFTEAGTKIREGKNDICNGSEWIGNNWRYYIIVDSEGRICYAVIYPSQGYGAPDGSYYYCDPYYHDYLTNPAFNILDGFGPWTPDTYNYNLYDVVIPEGGFAIVSHGTKSSELISYLTNNAITDCNETSSDGYLYKINTEKPYMDGLRLSYDLNSNEILI